MNIHGSVVCMARLRSTQIIPSTDFDPIDSQKYIHILPGKMGVLSLTLQLNRTSFTPRHTIIGKGVAYGKPLDPNLPLRPIEIKFENNRCCIEIYNTSDSTVEFYMDKK